MFQLGFVARTFTDMMRALFFFIDGLIYKFIGILYNLLVQIANTTIFTDDIIDMFASKVYGLLGIFMLFKVSFSIMTYIVNPDEFSDKNKGFSKIISNIVITLTLLLFTPWLFSQAMDIQRIVLKDNIIGKIFSSADSNSFSGIMEDVEISNAGSSMAYQTFKSFYHINYDQFPGCKGIEQGNENEQVCKSELDLSNSDYQKYKHYLMMAEATEDINRNRSYDLLNQEQGNDIFVEPYIMTYTPLVSTLVGGFMAWIFIIFCFDIAVRSVKLGFLRMIAPVPIISKIDPKGKGMFDKWVKVCVSTYLDLFIRLIAIFFSLFVIQQVFYMDFVNAATGLPETVNIWTKIFIVMGALLFAKQLPKLLQDLTGVKMDGKFTLNPFDKLRQVPLVGAVTSKTSSLLGGAITGGIAGHQAGYTKRGILEGMYAANKASKGKVPLMGGDGKNPHSFTSGLQAGYKSIKGKDYEVFNPLKYDYNNKGKTKIDELKGYKYDLQGEQASLDAELKSLYDQYTNVPEGKEKDKIREKIEINRSEYGKVSKHISTIDDQISDIKHMINIEESPQEDLDKAINAAREYKNSSKVNNEIYNGTNSVSPDTSAPTLSSNVSNTSNYTTNSTNNYDYGTSNYISNSSNSYDFSSSSALENASPDEFYEYQKRNGVTEQDFIERERVRAEQMIINDQMRQRISANNEDIAKWNEIARDPNITIGYREQVFAEINRLKQENKKLEQSIKENS